MTIDVSTLMPPVTGPASGGLQAGYGVSFTDLGRFEHAMQTSQTRLETQPVKEVSQAMQAVARPLEFVNNEAASIAELARGAMATDNTMSPGEMVMLSVRCQEFMFHCQLTSNVANRASDGLQQLFRQQS
ncbi:MAG: hypothetical protein RLZZ618_815 [Pseudomonadota bacterium]|jgi:hypothetical protein